MRTRWNTVTRSDGGSGILTGGSGSVSGVSSLKNIKKLGGGSTEWFFKSALSALPQSQHKKMIFIQNFFCKNVFKAKNSEHFSTFSSYNSSRFWGWLWGMGGRVWSREPYLSDGGDQGSLNLQKWVFSESPGVRYFWKKAKGMQTSEVHYQAWQKHTHTHTTHAHLDVVSFFCTARNLCGSVQANFLLSAS